MRVIDCAVLMVPRHHDWMRKLVADWAGLRERIALHCVYLDAVPGEPAASDCLRRQALALTRFDACLLPVTLETLAWTRTALAIAQGELSTPMLGLARGMSAAGLNDLLAFGLRDFVRDPLCEEELKTRLQQAIGAAADEPPERAAFQGVAEYAPPYEAEPMSDDGLREAFRSAKARVVNEFERGYIADLLTRHDSNISRAARSANKNRRAFWELMRKHAIAAEPFRRKGVGVHGR